MLYEAIADLLLQRVTFEHKVFNKPTEVLDNTSVVSKSVIEKAEMIINVLYNDMNAEGIQQMLNIMEVFCFEQGISTDDLKFRSELFQQLVHIFRTCASNYIDRASGMLKSFFLLLLLIIILFSIYR